MKDFRPLPQLTAHQQDLVFALLPDVRNITSEEMIKNAVPEEHKRTLLHAGFTGAVLAVFHYSGIENFPLTEYAHHKIRGHVLAGIRDRTPATVRVDYPVRVPRAVRGPANGNQRHL